MWHKFSDYISTSTNELIVLELYVKMKHHSPIICEMNPTVMGVAFHGH